MENKNLHTTAVVRTAPTCECGKICYNTEAEAFWNLWAYMGSYFQDREYAGMSPCATMWLAGGRLDWVMVHSRAELNGMFTADDVKTLLDCFQVHLFSQRELVDMPFELSGHLHYDAWCEPETRRLLATLIQLTPLQRLMLADALEQTRHRGINTEKKSLEQFYASLGIKLREPTAAG